VTLNHWRDRQRRVATRALPGDDRKLADVSAAEESLLEEEEYRRNLVARAVNLMQRDFEPTTWQAFWEHGMLGRSAAEVAAQLCMSPAAVYGAKFRVLTRLRQDLQGLID
jgi:RNA polymerase sigma-70 factor (ECF subfamily)